MGESIDDRLAGWEARLDRLEGKPELATGHLLFVPSPAGYELVVRDGNSPVAGELLELEGRAGRYTVLRVVRSPLPRDRRRCAYLEATSSGRRSRR
jgi:hypothetical protein